MLPGLSGQIAGLATSLPLTFVGTTVDTTSQANYTFSNVNIGGPGLIVVFVSARNTTSTSIENVSIGGSGASSAVKISPSTYAVGLFYRRIAQGNTTTITVNMDSSVTNCAIAVYRIVGNSSDTPFHTGSQTPDSTTSSVSLNIPASGVAIAGVQLRTTTTTSWTNVAENLDAAQGLSTYSTASSFYMAAQTGRTVTATSVAKTDHRLVAASWA